MTKRVNVQEVFNKVIDAGIYGDSIFQNPFMCHALIVAEKGKVITNSEASKAYYAIKDYLDKVNLLPIPGTDCMCNAMFYLGRLDLLDCNKGLPKSDYNRNGYACTALYRNWYRRPKVK